MNTSERLRTLYENLETLSGRSIGYPCNQDFDYSELLPFMRFSFNNVGDPFHDSNFIMNTHEFEREVVNTFADLMHVSPDDSWGYVTSGGTEGNMYGMYLARELFPDGIVYFSEDTHYSIAKILSLIKAATSWSKARTTARLTTTTCTRRCG